MPLWLRAGEEGVNMNRLVGCRGGILFRGIRLLTEPVLARV